MADEIAAETEMICLAATSKSDVFATQSLTMCNISSIACISCCTAARPSPKIVAFSTAIATGAPTAPNKKRHKQQSMQPSMELRARGKEIDQSGRLSESIGRGLVWEPTK